MSGTISLFAGRFTHQGRSSAVEIQRYIIKRGKRSVFSRPFSKKDDSETIAALKSDLDRIRRVLEVRSLTPACCPMIVTFCSQTEFATNSDAKGTGDFRGTSETRVMASDPRDDVSNSGVLEDRRDTVETDAAVSGVQHGSVHHYPTLSDKPADDHTITFDVNHRISKSQEGSSSQHRAVSISLTCSPQSSDSQPLSLMRGEHSRATLSLCLIICVKRTL